MPARALEQNGAGGVRQPVAPFLLQVPGKPPCTRVRWLEDIHDFEE
jgi:hypothetical protein